jgi:hypothetical protein
MSSSAESSTTLLSTCLIVPHKVPHRHLEDLNIFRPAELPVPNAGARSLLLVDRQRSDAVLITKIRPDRLHLVLPSPPA